MTHEALLCLVDLRYPHRPPDSIACITVRATISWPVGLRWVLSETYSRSLSFPPAAINAFSTSASPAFRLRDDARTAAGSSAWAVQAATVGAVVISSTSAFPWVARRILSTASAQAA